jgi:hypothetical protein
MQNIQVSRYENPADVGFQASIRPDDGAWVVFVDLKNDVSFWRRTEEMTAEGKVESRYVNVEALTTPAAPETPT